MRYLITLFALCLLAMSADAKTVTIGVDLSGSNPLLAHENFAAGASRFITEQLIGLKTGDLVRLKTFGARADANNLLDYTFKINRRMKPQKVAQIIAQYLKSLPEQKDVSQSSTNLIAWLEFTSGFNCANSSLVLVVTDGLEASSYVDPSQFLEGKQELPKPEVDLSGCAVVFYGLGAGWPAPSVRFVRNEWSKWAEKAGATFTAIIP